VKVDADGKPMTALAFLVRRDHSQYAGPMTLAEQARVIASARGAFGSSADYLERTRIALVSHGVVDPYLEQLAAAVKRLCPPATHETPTQPGEPPV
jgi:cation transport protein ChaC